MNTDALLFLGILAGIGTPFLAWNALKLIHVEVSEQEAVLITRFGKLVARIEEPGWHRVVDRVLPWVEVRRVSLRRDFRVVEGVPANDKNGTTLIADVFLELRVTDPEKAAFAVEDWRRSLHDAVVHTVTSLVATRDLDEVLGDKGAIAEGIKRELADECVRWGVAVERAYLQRLSVLPDVAQRLFETVAARLERQKADIEELGHQRVAELEAETAAQTAALVARAKGQYPAAIGRAYEVLRGNPSVQRAYEELYALSQLRPHRTMTFQGFSDGAIRPADAAMLQTDGVGYRPVTPDAE